MDSLHYIAIVFSKGGFVMYPLLACSIVVVAIAIERTLSLYNARTNMNELLPEIALALEKKSWDTASEICSHVKGVSASMLAAGFRYASEYTQQFEQSIDAAAGETVNNLRKYLDILDVIVTLAPLLGLLGTVTGMIQSFSVLTMGQGQAMAITGGVGEALIATATGLCVAILSLVTRTYFSYRVNAIIADMEKTANHVLLLIPRGVPHEIQ